MNMNEVQRIFLKLIKFFPTTNIDYICIQPEFLWRHQDYGYFIQFSLPSPSSLFMFSLFFSCLLKIRRSKSLKYSFQTPVYTDHVDLALELPVSFNWFMVQEDAAVLICSPIDILLALRLPQMLGPGLHWVISPDSCRRQLPCQAHMKCLCWTVLSPRTEPYQILYVGLESWLLQDELWDVHNNQRSKAKTVVSMGRTASFKETSCTNSPY